MRSGTTNRKKTSILDIEENAAIEKVKRLSRRFAPKGANIENLGKKLFHQNLRIANVLGDGSCFFRALSYQLFGDAESHQIVCQTAADQVLRNPELYAVSLINNDIQNFVLSLSKDREWTDNHAIQAAADAFGVSIQITNSNSASFASVTFLPFLPVNSSKPCKEEYYSRTYRSGSLCFYRISFSISHKFLGRIFEKA